MSARFQILLTASMALFVAVPGSLAQSSNDKAVEDNFGDIFVHPRDRHYLPGTAPSRAKLFKHSENSRDGQGKVERWEYRKGNRTINRETWIEPDGTTSGSFKIGRKF